MVGGGELALMWARSGSGKSTVTLNIVRNTPEIPTLIVNMEMTPRRQAEWLTAMTFDLGVPSRHVEDILKWGNDDDRYENVDYALKRMGEQYPDLHFWMPNRPTIPEIAYKVEDLAETGPRPTRVFIDHLTLMKGATDYSGVVATSSGLHSWAMNEGLAVYVLQQAGRYAGDGKNYGHLPVTLNDGVFGGEADADWVFGMYRPSRDPKYLRPRESYDDLEKFHRTQMEYDRVKNLVKFQVIKNRTFGDLLESGLDLWYSPQTRRLEELGAFIG